MLSRLRNDFQLAILTLFGACAVLGVTPFAFYRFATGNRVAGSIDLSIVACIALAVLHAWRSGNAHRAASFAMAASLVGCLAIATLLGVSGLFWMYPTLLANFLLVGRRQAGIASVLALGFLALHGGAFASPVQAWMFLSSAAVVVLFAFLFAHRTESQRQQLESLASHDPLTGACNRRAMERELRDAIDANRRDAVPFGLVLLDLDHFKRINDQHGHDAGDRVLVEFATLARLATRKSDRLFRFGGEEFVLLLPGAGRGDLAEVAEKVRRRVAAQLRCGDQGVTVSIGAAALQPGETWHAWLSRADMALYRAKAEGRDRVVVADDAAAPRVRVAAGDEAAQPA
ncbi:MAG TPA: GGDEF domain-containing protein [Xanthomonadaceae bacterium]|nr:GGDEF domain-containing protein [Xanthomonadaceae bacterium]